MSELHRRLAQLEQELAALRAALPTTVVTTDDVQTIEAAKTISTSTSPPLTVERLTTATNTRAFTERLRAKSSNDMVDGFGPSLAYAIQDNAGVSNDIAQIAAVRNGADNSGDLVFLPYSAGVVTEHMRLKANGDLSATNIIGQVLKLGPWVVPSPTIVDHAGSITISVPRNVNINAVQGYAITPAVGTAATIDIEYKRGGGAWTTLYSSLPTFAVGSNTPSSGSLSTTTLNADDLLRLNFDAVNSLAGVSVWLKVTTR